MTEPTVNEDQNPLTKPKFIISAVVVAIIVALGIVLALLPKGGGTPTAEPSNSGPTTASTQPSAAAAASVCGLPSSDQAKPATTPTDTKWELVGKIAAPTSPTQFGPGKTEANGLRSCFAHSPTGALFAGANMIVLGSSGRPDLLAQHLVVEGPERDKMLAEPPTNAPTTAPFQIAGYKIVDYAGNRAVVEYGLKAANGSVGSVPVAMQWQGGDWKWVLPATGMTEARQLSDLNGFISWAGV
ncbi:hypothetical protein LFT44_21260 (plasmid) [Arthrobacter sp. FW306-05-C]|uniref:hypothetical protein n=1 Tax=unclassified Arthrobacter TaxID=235627 RepID=UPI001F31BD85|nr:hypothetical protein [Arthrobacter sp. FW306-05-C]UKA69053.1 hypothetical protein LFT44_21260 [Arthrobacter sp. FW306-05-C]